MRTLCKVFILIALFISLTACKATKGPCTAQLAFWPPDLVPHPILPEPEPYDPLAIY